MGTDGKRFALLLGGARSGKSSLAERMAEQLAPDRKVLYVATAKASDDEMRDRIAVHRAARPSDWRTLEEPVRLGATIADVVGDARVVIVDCATIWVSNTLLAHLKEDGTPTPDAESHVVEAVGALLDWYRSSSASMIVVSNEVGLGLVPPYPLGRAYRDILGRVNQQLAATADEVYMLIAGLPVELKALSARFGPDWADDRSAL